MIRVQNLRRRAVRWAGAALLALGWLGATGVPGAADPALEACGNPNLPAHDTLTQCQQALRNPRLAPEQRAAVLVNLGVAQAAMDRHGDAVRSYGLAIATVPNLAAAYANRARSHMAQGRMADAERDFSKPIEIAPREPDAWLGRGALFLRVGQPLAAEADLSKALALRPESGIGLFNRGLARLALARNREAAADFTAVIREYPDDAGAHMNRGRALAGSDPAGAAADFDRAIALAPDWGAAYLGRGHFRDSRGQTEAANADFLRAHELGVVDQWLSERVRRISGG